MLESEPESEFVSLLAALRRPDPAVRIGIEFGRGNRRVLGQGAERNESRCKLRRLPRLKLRWKLRRKLRWKLRWSLLELLLDSLRHKER